MKAWSRSAEEMETGWEAADSHRLPTLTIQELARLDSRGLPRG